MSLASPYMDDLEPASTRTQVEAAPKRRWSARRTLAFVVVTSVALWAAIVALVLHLL